MNQLNLAGKWNVLFDPKDEGLENKWFKQAFENRPFTLPGTQATNKVGEKLDETLADELNKESVQSFRECHSYRAAMWLQKVIEIPTDFNAHDLTLFLERTLGSTHVWIDDVFVGTHYSLSTPHQYEISADKIGSKDQIKLTIRLDNRNAYHLGELTSGYSEHTQGFWSGIVGEVSLHKGKLLNENVSVYYDFQQKAIIVSCPKVSEDRPEIRLSNQNDQEMPSTIKLMEEEPDCYTFVITDNKELTWNEFTPEFYQVILSYGEQELKKRVAIVEPKSTTDSITLAGKKVFLRGTLDCAVFPKTGHPAMDENEWERIFLTLKDYGVNHVRYHCWCPPEAAFTVADRLGMYLMVEGPFWLDEWFNNSVGDHPEHYELIRQECLDIVSYYGHHPSFLLFSVGNELHGDFDFLSQVLNHENFTRNQILTTITANTTNYQRDFYEGADDFFVGVQYEDKGLRGNRFLDEMVTGTDLNYEEGAKKVPVPVITHEIGQYASYPALNEIEKLNGPMVPANLQAIKNDLIKKDMEQEHEDFTFYSGKLALELYKAEIEAAIRTRSLSGFQLLGIQDYPGQDTAMIGMLDSRWEEKGFCTSEDFISFCDEVVPIVEMEKRVYEASDVLTFNLGIRNSLLEDIHSLKANVTIKRADKILYEKDFTGTVEQGSYEVIAQGEIDLNALDFNFQKGETVEVIARVEAPGKTYQNQWDIWIFPSEEKSDNESVIYDRWLSPKVLEGLQRGENCLVSIDARRCDFVELGNYFPVFWSPVFFESPVSCGVMIDKSHPIFRQFPTETHPTLQWKKLLESSVSFPLYQYQAIIQTIPNFYHNERRSPLVEFSVGKGKLLLTGFDLERGESIEEKQLKQAILNYMESDSFDPGNRLSLDELTAAYPSKELSFEHNKEDLAYRKPAWADNEQSEKMSAAKANDGNHLTYWTTAAQTDGHWWCVDLGTVQKVNTIVVDPLNPEDLSFDIFGSNDEEHWEMIARSDEPQERHVLTVSTEYRFIRIDLMHPINTAAGLKNVQIY